LAGEVTCGAKVVFVGFDARATKTYGFPKHRSGVSSFKCLR